MSEIPQLKEVFEMTAADVLEELSIVDSDRTADLLTLAGEALTIAQWAEENKITTARDFLDSIVGDYEVERKTHALLRKVDSELVDDCPACVTLQNVLVRRQHALANAKLAEAA